MIGITEKFVSISVPVQSFCSRYYSLWVSTIV